MLSDLARMKYLLCVHDQPGVRNQNHKWRNRNSMFLFNPPLFGHLGGPSGVSSGTECVGRECCFWDKQRTRVSCDQYSEISLSLNFSWPVRVAGLLLLTSCPSFISVGLLCRLFRLGTPFAYSAVVI